MAGDTLTKDDLSPVTVADYAAQAVVCAELVDALGDIAMVGEEEASELREPGNATLLDGVVGLVGGHRAGASASEVLEWISAGSSDGSADRYWTLDPIDGTKGFLRGDQSRSRWR